MKKEKFQYLCFVPECKNRTREDATQCGFHLRQLEKQRRQNSKGLTIAGYNRMSTRKGRNKYLQDLPFIPNDQKWFHEVYNQFSHPQDRLNVIMDKQLWCIVNPKFKYIINFYNDLSGKPNPLKDLKYAYIEVKEGDLNSVKLMLDKIMKKRKIPNIKVTLYKEGEVYFSYSYEAPISKKKESKVEEEKPEPKTFILRKRLTT